MFPAIFYLIFEKYIALSRRVEGMRCENGERDEERDGERQEMCEYVSKRNSGESVNDVVTGSGSSSLLLSWQR